MEKRDFVKKVSAATLLASLGIPLDSCNPNSIPEPDPKPQNTDPVLIDLTMAPYTDLLNDQGWVLDETNKLLLLNLNGEIIALTSICTHALCSTDWDYNTGDMQFLCRCHNSIFGADGTVVLGPATSPLTRYEVSREGDILTVNK
jgi:cytochrome b6-f complex iron-sulfur subunit